jgi:hypothetical protein
VLTMYCRQLQSVRQNTRGHVKANSSMSSAQLAGASSFSDLPTAAVCGDHHSISRPDHCCTRPWAAAA